MKLSHKCGNKWSNATKLLCRSHFVFKLEGYSNIVVTRETVRFCTENLNNRMQHLNLNLQVITVIATRFFFYLKIMFEWLSTSRFFVKQCSVEKIKEIKWSGDFYVSSSLLPNYLNINVLPHFPNPTCLCMTPPFFFGPVVGWKSAEKSALLDDTYSFFALALMFVIQ